MRRHEFMMLASARDCSENKIGTASMRNLVAMVSPVLAGCVTVGSDVVPVGKDTYQLSMTGVGFATQANTNIKALKAANDYCSKMNKHMVPQHSAESGVYGWSP